jgi:transcriptional regulator with XRE-family HTH domain
MTMDDIRSDRIEFGERLKEWISNNYPTITEFAKCNGLNYSNLYGIICGTTCPPFILLKKFIKIGIPILDWLEIDEEKIEHIKLLKDESDIHIPKITGSEFKTIREFYKLSQFELAAKMGYKNNKYVVSIIESKINKYVDAKSVNKLLVALFLSSEDVDNILSRQDVLQNPEVCSECRQDKHEHMQNTVESSIIETDEIEYITNNVNDILCYMSEKFGDEWIEFIQNRRKEESEIIE